MLAGIIKRSCSHGDGPKPCLVVFLLRSHGEHNKTLADTNGILQLYQTKIVMWAGHSAMFILIQIILA